MLKKVIIALILGLSLTGFSLFLAPSSLPSAQAAEDCDAISCNKNTQSEDEYLSCNKRKQGCWETNIKEAQSAANTLSNTISILNGKISVQLLQIEQTLGEINKLDREITDLGDRIQGLNLSLDRLSTVLVQRVNEHYKTGRSHPPIMLLVSESFNQFFTNYKYLKLTQEQTADAMSKAETQRITYDEQKALKEKKQQEVEAKRASLETQQKELTKQKGEQQFLLQETKNNEAKYQQELQKTLDELEAIQSIIAGKGNESKSGEVSEGDTIASIIVGASPCSTGTHLHFETVRDGVHRDPAGFLKSVDVIWQNQPDSSFGWGGNWEWPLNDPAKINQGYGMTYYARVKRSYGGAPHTGIDIVSKSGNVSVKAVKAGTLYRGSIKCGGGLLKYVKVQHKEDSSLSTYYLHVNY